jgi:S-DNA-T family DNA segregation ATPase FtsK/SpoIIIE
VPLDALNISDFNTRQGGELVIGLVDDPELQEQYPATISWEDDGGILVLGSGGSGRTTALRTIAASLASSCSPAQAALYALDFNNRALEALHVLGNTVEVAHADEPERVTAVIIAVEEHITRNKNLLARHQVSSFSELIDSGVEAQRCVLLLDDYASFHSAYEKLDGSDWITRLHTIVTQGRQAGVHVALTADRRASVPSALFSTIGKRVVLRISDADEMVALGVKHHSDAPDGRAWLSRGLACQLAVVGQDRSARGQAEALEKIGAAQRDRNEKLFILPETVSSLNLRTDGDVAIGVEDLTGAEALVDLDMGHVFVTGPPRSGKTNLLLSIASQAALNPDSYVFALSVSGTLDDPRWLYGDKNNAGEVLEACKAASTGLDLKCSALLVIDDAEDFAEGSLATLIQDVMSQPGVRVVCATESHYLSRAYSGWLADVKRPRRAVLLQPDLEMEGQLVSMRLKVRPGVTFGVGRGLYVRESGVSVVQTSSFGF